MKAAHSSTSKVRRNKAKGEGGGSCRSVRVRVSWCYSNGTLSLRPSPLVRDSPSPTPLPQYRRAHPQISTTDERQRDTRGEKHAHTRTHRTNVGEDGTKKRRSGRRRERSNTRHPDRRKVRQDGETRQCGFTGGTCQTGIHRHTSTATTPSQTQEK